jgi:hypothetical protein
MMLLLARLVSTNFIFFLEKSFFLLFLTKKNLDMLHKFRIEEGESGELVLLQRKLFLRRRRRRGRRRASWPSWPTSRVVADVAEVAVMADVADVAVVTDAADVADVADATDK